MRVGINPIVWSNDDLRTLGGDIPLDVCLAEAAAAGYSGIELGHKFPRDPDVLGPVLQRHGLRLVSGWHGTRLLERSVDEEIGALEPHAALLRAMGAEVVIIAEVSGAVHCHQQQALTTRPVLGVGQLERLAVGLDAVGAHLDGMGLRLVYHHHAGTVIETPEETAQLLAATGSSVSLVFDTGHFAFAGGDAVAFLRQWASRVGHVHLKDVRQEVLQRVRARDGSFLDAVLEGVFTVPGDGDLDFLPVFQILASVDYHGWLIVEAEQDPNRANPAQYAKKGLLHVQHCAEAAELA